jgi:hypothetical protein
LEAGTQPEVRWQVSQDAVVWMCVRGLPEFTLPLWQVAQLPGTTPEWLNLVPMKLLVVWQVSQVWVVGRWFCDITTLPRAKRMPAWWQEAQSRGVPLNTALRWQDSQRVLT